jgi:hypothetical protein
MQSGHDGAAPGLIAGAGSLPLEAARLLGSGGPPPSAIAFEGLTDPRLEAEVGCIRWLRLGQLDEMARALAELDLETWLLVGKVPKSVIFEGGAIASPDAEALRLLAESRDRGDEALMTAIARWLDHRGFRLCDQSRALRAMLAPAGPLGARAPGAGELADLEIGWPIVQQLGRAGVGQCVVMKQGCVLAVEAIEGTDAAIRRAGELGGAGATVIKAARPDQDRRFDLPAVGPGTLDAMRDAGATALAIEAGSTLVLDRAEFVRAADRAGIAVWGFETGRGAA